MSRIIKFLKWFFFGTPEVVQFSVPPIPKELPTFEQHVECLQRIFTVLDRPVLNPIRRESFEAELVTRSQQLVDLGHKCVETPADLEEVMHGK